MFDDVGDIAAFYDEDPTREHGRLERHQLEYEMTWRYLDEYLPGRGSILDVGAATGRYAIPLAKRGYDVTAVDLSPALIDAARRHATELEVDLTWVVADSRDLSSVSGRDFDAVLLMGPLYHLAQESDRRLALQQAHAKLCDGGVILSAFLSRLGVLGDLMKKDPAWIERHDEVRSLLEDGRRPDDAPRGGFRGYFGRASEIAPLHESVGFETVTVAAIEPTISAEDEIFNRLEGTQRERWLDLLFEISSTESILDSSRHLLYVGRRPG